MRYTVEVHFTQDSDSEEAAERRVLRWLASNISGSPAGAVIISARRCDVVRSRGAVGPEPLALLDGPRKGEIDALRAVAEAAPGQAECEDPVPRWTDRPDPPGGVAVNAIEAWDPCGKCPGCGLNAALRRLAEVCGK